MIIGSLSGWLMLFRDDGAAAGDFAAHEFRGDFLGNAGAEVLARVLAAEQRPFFAQLDRSPSAIDVGAAVEVSRMATYSISGVMMPFGRSASATLAPALARRGLRCRPGKRSSSRA